MTCQYRQKGKKGYALQYYFREVLWYKMLHIPHLGTLSKEMIINGLRLTGMPLVSLCKSPPTIRAFPEC